MAIAQRVAPLVPPLPGTPTLDLVSTSGLTLGSSSSTWVDTVSGYTFTTYGGGNIVAGTLNTIVSPKWVSQSVESYFTDGSITMGTLVSSESAWTLAVVAQYTGATTSAGATYVLPTVFADSDSYGGICMVLDSTDSTKIRVTSYSYPDYATGAGASGSASAAHVVIAQLSSGTLTTYLDGTSVASLSAVATGWAPYNPQVGYGESGGTQFQGPIARIVVWNSGTVSPSGIYASLKAIYGTP
jgi:hypothetical protein